MEWKQTKPHMWERSDELSVACTTEGKCTAARPNGLMCRGGDGKLIYFPNKDAAIAFVDRHFPAAN